MVCRINYLNLNYLKFNYLKLGKIALLSCFAYQPVSREGVGCFEVLLCGARCRDDATSDFGTGWFTGSYVIWCGLLAKKLPKIHAGNKWYLIINVL